MQSEPMKTSALDLLSAFLTGRQRGEGAAAAAADSIAGDRELLVLLVTSVAMLLGCAALILWRRSPGQKSPAKAEPQRLAALREAPELEMDDGKKKVTVFFGTQTGTAEGFAKVRSSMLAPCLVLTFVGFLNVEMLLLQSLAEEAKARYDKAKFKVVDLVKKFFLF